MSAPQGSDSSSANSLSTGHADSLDGHIFYTPGLNTYCFRIAPGRSVWHVLPGTCGCALSTCSSCQYEDCGSLSYDTGSYSKTMNNVQWFSGGSGDRRASLTVAVDPHLTSPVWSITTPPEDAACPVASGHGPCYLISVQIPPSLATSPPPAPPVSQLVEVHPVSAKLSSTYRMGEHKMDGHKMIEHNISEHKMVEHDMSHATPCVALACVDGYEGVSLRHPHCDGTCHTDEIIGSSPWLEVDLGAAQTISYVQIFNHPTCSKCQAWLGRDGPYELWVGDAPGNPTTRCAHATAPPTAGPFTTACPANGRFLTLYLPTTSGVKRILNIAEMKVFASGPSAPPPPPGAVARGGNDVASLTLPSASPLGGDAYEDASIGGPATNAPVGPSTASVPLGTIFLLLMVGLLVIFWWQRRGSHVARRQEQRFEKNGLVSSETLEEAARPMAQPAVEGIAAALEQKV